MFKYHREHLKIDALFFVLFYNRSMSIIIKKFITSLILLLVFLSPLSIQLNSSSNINSELPTVSIVENSAYALSVPCTGGWWKFVDNTACGIGNVILTYFELIWFYTTQILVVLVGLMFDAFLFFSIDSKFYRSGMIEAGWEILRDFTNIAFIFALLIQAFQMVLGVNIPKARNKLVKVILVALVINFSLFVTYAIIDASNILAYTFYNKIEQNEVTFDASSNGGNGNKVIKSDEQFKGKSVSLAIAKKINPQELLDAKTVSNGKVTKGQRVVMVLMVGVINGVLIYVFLSVTFLFLGRTIGLWLSAVLAPLAFASLTVPAMQKMEYIGFGKWFNSLLKMAFMAPVFLFFLYLAVQFMKIDIVGTGAGAGSGAFINNNA